MADASTNQTPVGRSAAAVNDMGAVQPNLVVPIGVAQEKDHALTADIFAPVTVPVGIASEQDHAVAVGAEALVLPTLGYVPWAVARLLRDCLCLKLEETIGGTVCRCSLMAGDQAMADICEKVPDRGDGQAWVRVVRIFNTIDFPRPVTDQFNCSGSFWAAEYELGVLRCAVTPDRNALPPTGPELDAEAAMVLDDAAALLWVGECCLSSDFPVIVGDWQPTGSGGCTGGRITMMVHLVPGPHVDVLAKVPPLSSPPPPLIATWAAR